MSANSSEHPQAPPQGQMRVPTYVAFHDAQKLSGKEFTLLVRQIASMVESVVSGVEAETVRCSESR